MATVTIPIPDNLPAEQRDELVDWLTKQAATAAPEREAFEDDPAYQAATARRIEAGIKAADEGRVFTSDEVRDHLRAVLDEPR